MSNSLLKQTGNGSEIIVYVPNDVFTHIEMEVISWQVIGHEDYVKLPTNEREVRIDCVGPDIIFRPQTHLQCMYADAQDNWWWRKKANEAERELNEIKRKAS